jgi:hypothetical protein
MGRLLVALGRPGEQQRKTRPKQGLSHLDMDSSPKVAMRVVRLVLARGVKPEQIALERRSGAIHPKRQTPRQKQRPAKCPRTAPEVPAPQGGGCEANQDGVLGHVPAFDDEEPVPNPEPIKPLLEAAVVAQALDEVYANRTTKQDVMKIRQSQPIRSLCGG